MSVRRRGNGLTAQSYVLLLDVDPRLSGQLLTALATAGVAAYATPSVGRTDPFLHPQASTRPLEAVHVDATRRPDARRVLEATMPDVTIGLPSVEEEDQFAALVAGWDEEPEGHPWPNAEDVEPPRRRKTDRPRPTAEPPRDGPEQPAPPTDQAAPPGTTSPEEEAAAEPGPASEAGAAPSADAPTDAGKDIQQIAPPTSLTKPDQNGHGAGADAPRVGRGTDQDGKQQNAQPQDGTEQDEKQEPKEASDEVEDNPDDAEGHFVRPPLAPLPPSHPVTKWGLVALGLGLLLLIFPTLVGLEHTTAVDFAGVLCIIGAVGLLVSRLSSRSTDDYEGPDDGAVV